jgi:hypothetical protein
MKRRNLYWSGEEIESLRQHIQAGGSINTAAVRFRRTQSALRTQAKAMGLKFLTIRERRRKALGSEADRADRAN